MQPQSPSNPYETSSAGIDQNSNVFCRQCGQKIQASANYCPFCHCPQIPGKEKSKVVAAMLAFFLGFFGAHRLYLGQWRGIIYWFFGLFAWIVAIIEGIVFLATSKDRWKMKYGHVNTNTAVIVAVSVVGFIVVMGILAAIALPAYQDYTNRTKVAQTLVESRGLERSVERYFDENGTLPINESDIDRESPIRTKHAEIYLEKGATIKIMFNDPANSRLSGETMVITPIIEENSLYWDCSGGTLPAVMRPNNCRTGNNSGQQSDSNTQLEYAKDSSFQIRVPSHWSYTPSIADENSLFEFANLRREEYILIFNNPKSEYTGNNSAEFANFFVDNMGVKIFSKSSFKKLSINGYEATQISVDGEVNNISVSYFLTFIGTDEGIYTLIQWTLPENKGETWPLFKGVASSFELSKNR